MIRLDGIAYDIPNAERLVTHFSSETRATMRASHRLGFRQREQIMDTNWTHELCPGVCFPTRIAALRAALATLGVS
jgi:hypothetical protein